MPGVGPSPAVASEPVVVPDLAVAAPHGVVLTDPAPGETDGPTGPVLPTD